MQPPESSVTDTDNRRTPDAGIDATASDAPSPPAPAPSITAPAQRQSAADPARPGRGPLLVAVVAVAVAGLVAAWTIQRFERIESDLARRLQAQDQKSAALDAMLRASADMVRDLQGRTSVLESKGVETASLQAQLEKLFRDRAEDSFDVLLAEVDATLGLAAQQLALGADVRGVLAALQNLEARIVRYNDPRLAPLRAGLLRDIEKLRLFPASDAGALAIRIDALLAAIDKLPLVNSVRGHTSPAGGASGGGDAGESSQQVPPTTESRWEALLPESLRSVIVGMGREVGDLFRVRRIDQPDSLLLSPDQEYFLRQNLRLLLLNARLALLSRNEAVFRADLERARRWVETYYDGEQRTVVAVRAQIDQLLAARLALEPPRLDDSVGAARLLRAGSR
jgi:uncharacterized protein HemX